MSSPEEGMSPPEEGREGLPASLARLDQRLVPTLQRGARRAARGLGAPLRAVARLEERLFPRVVRRVVPAWRVPALLAAVIVVLASAVHLQRFPELRDAAREAADAPAAAPGRTSGEVDPMDVSASSIGPRQGDDLGAYVAERRPVLAALASDDDVAAVVSFSEYVTAEEGVAALPEDVRVLRAQYRIPAEGERPREIDVDPADPVTDIEAAIAGALGPIEEEITEVEALLDSGTVEEREFEADLERRLSELVSVRNLLEAAPEIVFALVVEGPVDGLQALAEHTDVRLVDPAPPGADAADTAFYGLLPEDRDRASFGSAR